MIPDTVQHEGGRPPITLDIIERATAEAAQAAAERVALESEGLSPLGARLAQELKRHDWDHDDSDDGQRVARGRAQAKEIHRLFLVCDRAEAARLWWVLAPAGVAPPRRPSLDPSTRPPDPPSGCWK
jgi:hypothetical protein